MSRRTLLVGLAHPDDELGAAGAIRAQLARGDRVVLAWLTPGEMTEAFGDLPPREVAERRREQGHRAGEILGAETRFLDYHDTHLVADRSTAVRVAQLLCEIKPDGLLTWGDAWVRGMRHPDHQACGKIFRDAVTLARIAKVVAPLPPHREPLPVFTLRDAHSPLPAVGVDVEPHLDAIHELARFYLQGIGFGDPEWLDHRLRTAGAPFGLRYAEAFDAWETEPGPVEALLPAEPIGYTAHPDREKVRA